jgi:spermidine synthase
LSALLLYGAAELLIGVGAFAVPALFTLGERYLLGSGQTDSIGYLFSSAVVLAVSILPWCVCMGATFPFMMAFVREWDRQFTGSFSYLYLANVLGAMSGTFMTAAVLVEAYGFQHTLWIAASGNFAIAAASVGVAWSRRKTGVIPLEVDQSGPEAVRPELGGMPGRQVKWLLFSTGFCSMAMEVVWSRSFTPVLKTQVYSFAAVVFAYLGATFLGSLLYRWELRRNRARTPAVLISLLPIAALLPVIVNDPGVLRMAVDDSIDLFSIFSLLASIAPLCAILGYLTPMVIDRYAVGRPKAAGKAYAVNVLGCILGPLAASYLLLPHCRERYALVLLTTPFFIFSILQWRLSSSWMRWGSAVAAIIVLGSSLFFSSDFDDWMTANIEMTTTRRDYAASVTANGTGMQKRLLVNGMGMTKLTPITKIMVHLPLALLKSRPRSALIICFGMGTSYRSALSWNVDATAVELVPGVTKLFGFFHADAGQLLKQPRSQIVIDDGRRYLQRVRTQYDLITIDPPPPIEAAGSSLLYSREFLELAKRRLRPGGILQIWIPRGEVVTGQAVLRTVKEAFPYVRGFVSLEGWGLHVLASMTPIESVPAADLAERFPEAAKRDLLEWTSSRDVAAYLQRVLSRECAVDQLLNPDAEIRITDDKPFNEYFLMRRFIFRRAAP